MTDERQHQISDLLHEIYLVLFDGGRAISRVKAISDFVGVITRVAVVKSLDDYIKIRPSRGDGFSQLLEYTHWVLFVLYWIMMYSIFVAIFDLSRRIFLPFNAHARIGSVAPVVLLALFLFSPVVLFINEGSRIAVELVSAQKNITQNGTIVPSNK